MTVIQLKRGLAATWASINPILSPGEFGYETDTGKYKLGNGSAAWNALPYVPRAADKGQPNGIASLDSSGLVPTTQIPPGLIIDGVTLQNTDFQFTSGGTPIGSPISLLVATLDGGSPTSTSAGYIDGGTV